MVNIYINSYSCKKYPHISINIAASHKSRPDQTPKTQTPDPDLWSRSMIQTPCFILEFPPHAFWSMLTCIWFEVTLVDCCMLPNSMSGNTSMLPPALRCGGHIDMFLVKGFYCLCDVRTYNVKKYGLMFDVAPGPDRVAVLASISSAALAEKVNTHVVGSFLAMLALGAACPEERALVSTPWKMGWVGVLRFWGLTCMNAYYLSGLTIYSVAMLPSNGCWGHGVLGAHMYECLQSTTPVLLCTTKDYSSTTLYYKVLPCATKYHSSTTLYYKVLLQYYLVLQSTTPVLTCTTKYFSALQSTTPVLPCTTKYYSSTNLYYKVLLCTTKYYSSTTLYYKVLHDWSASHMKRHLQCAEQQKAASSFSKYCDCHAKWISWLIRIAYETSFTMRRATGITLQLHQILRLPRKMNLMIDPHHIWNVIYNGRSNSQHPPTSPNTAPATQNESHDWSTSHMKRRLQCAEQQSTPSNLTKYCACHAKWISWLIHITYETSFTMRGATVNTLQPHQILRLPRKRSVMIDPQHIWNVIYNPRSDRHHPATSPNTAPATQNCTPKS